MSRSRLAVLAIGLLMLLATTPSFAESIIFDLTSQGYGQETPVSGTLFRPQGLLLSASSPAVLMTACGGQCLTASYGGTLNGQFVLPNTDTATTVTGLSLIGLPLDTSVYAVYDADGNLLSTLSQTGTLHVDTWEVSLHPEGVDMPVYAYTGNTPVSSFSIDFKFDAVYGVTFTPTTVASGVPEPASLLLLGSGLTALAGAIRKKVRKHKTSFAFTSRLVKRAIAILHFSVEERGSSSWGVYP